MSRGPLFYMDGPLRQLLLTSHSFYVEQARKRLLSQFGDIEAEAHKASEEWLNQASHCFNPDEHDPGDFYEVNLDFSAATPGGGQLNGTARQNRPDLRNGTLPVEGGTAIILYVDDSLYKLL